MKQMLKNYILITFSLLICTVFISLILTILEHFNILNGNALFIMGYAFSYLLIACFSFMLGIKMKRKALLHGGVFSLIILLFNLMLFGELNFIKLITKIMLILFFVILGVNKKNSQ